jgi:copper homeostasis protein
MFLELACFSLEDAIVAAELGVHRIEFCQNYEIGGITPVAKDFKLLRAAFPKLPIHVMIRARGGDFFYSKDELAIMEEQLKTFLDLGADGFVFGALKPIKTSMPCDVDLEACELLIDAAKHKPCVFHRAIDEVANVYEAITTLSALGFQGVLTSGATPVAAESANQLSDLQKVHQKLDIIAGGGVRSSNAYELLNTSLRWIHSAAWHKEQKRMNEAEALLLLDYVK